MFSSEKCSDSKDSYECRLPGGSPSGSELPVAELFTSMGEALTKEGLPPDEVASAVAAASDEIGDILKDELGDADRAERIGAKLADLSAELGLLAGLADGETHKAGFPSLFEIAMGHRSSASASSSSSTWSGARCVRARRAARPPRVVRRRPIAKGKELVRRRPSRATGLLLGAPRVEVVSEDASDVGADTDSDDQWTELDEACSSESSSVKETVAIGDFDCNGFSHKGQEPEAPPMGQFLLPLLSTDAASVSPPEHFLIRHEDILQLLASAEESARGDLPECEEATADAQPETALPAELFTSEEPTPVSPEEEAAVLHYVCEAERQPPGERIKFRHVEDWLLGIYHSWCEISALMYTMIGATSVGIDFDGWLYRARFGCHCRLCMCLVSNAEQLAQLVHRILLALASDESTMRDAVTLMRALGLREPGTPLQPQGWDLSGGLKMSLQGALIVQEQLQELATEGCVTRELMWNVCVCRPSDFTNADEYWAVTCLCRMLECFKAAFNTTFKVEILPAEGERDERLEAATRRLAHYLAPYQRCSTAVRLADMVARTQPAEVKAWSGYDHNCECLSPQTLCAQQRKELLRLSFFGLMQFVSELGGSRFDSQPGDGTPPCESELEGTSRELPQGEGICPKPPDCPSDQAVVVPDGAEKDPDEDRPIAMDLGDDWEAGSGTASLGLSTSSSLDSASELLLAAAAAVESASEAEAPPGELCRTVRHLMHSITAIERLMDRVLHHCSAWPLPHDDAETRKRADAGLSEVDRKLMAMYRRLPEVHQKQLQVYRKQKKLSTVCMQLVGGRAPAPPPPGSPPPASPPHQASRPLCPEYHLQRFKEVRRKVMHMRDQQLYYHRLRMWLEDQLRQEKARCVPESTGSVTLVEEMYVRRKRRPGSPKHVRKTAAAKRKLRPHTSPSLVKPHKILQMLKCKSPPNVAHSLLESAVKFQNGGVVAEFGEPKTDDKKPEVDPPEVFCYRENVVVETFSDTDTIVGEKDDLCKEMKECLARFANFALNSPDANLNAIQTENLQQELTMEVNAESLRPETVIYPDSLSPPLQELSPTIAEPLPVYRVATKSSQSLLTVNKLLNRSANMLDRLKDDIRADFNKATPISTPDLLNIRPLNARRMSMLIEDVKLDCNTIPEPPSEAIAALVPSDNNRVAILDNASSPDVVASDQAAGKDPNVYKYVTFGLEIKKAIEECQNIINSCNSYIRVSDNGDVPAENPQVNIKEIEEANDSSQAEKSQQIPPNDDVKETEHCLSFEQIYEAIMSLDKNSTDILECMDRTGDSVSEPIEGRLTKSKLVELVENMPQILANIPDIASKLSEFANATFEFPEFATIMHTMPDLNNEAQLTPETLKQIRELRINKCRDSVKVTKHTAKRKTNRRIRNSLDNDVIGTITFDFDSKDISHLIKDEKELQAHLKNKASSKEDYKDLLFSVSAQVVTNRVFEYIKQTKSPELAKCFEEEWKIHEMIDAPKHSIMTEMCSKASTLFDDSVKDSLSMSDLRELVETRFSSWKHYVAAKFKSIPMEMLDNEIEAMLDKFYSYIQDLADKPYQDDSIKALEKLDNDTDKKTDKEKLEECKHSSTKDSPNDVSKSDSSKTDLVKSTNPCDCTSQTKPSEIESLKQIMKFIKDSVGSTFDIIIMQTSKMSKERKNSIKNLKFKYLDVILRCVESPELAGWIILDPELAANVILEMTGMPPKKALQDTTDFTAYTNEKKQEYFLMRLKEMNRDYMESLPKNLFSGDEWLVMLYRLEQLETNLKEALAKVCIKSTKPAQTQTQSNVSETREAELLAGRGLSKIINQANAKPVKKAPQATPPAIAASTEAPKSPPKVENVAKPIEKPKVFKSRTVKEPVKASIETDKQCQYMSDLDCKARNDALLAKCEAILTSRGDKVLLDSFYTIKSYITQGLPVPESYKKHVISICSNIDAKLLDEDIEESLSKVKTTVVETKPEQPADKPKPRKIDPPAPTETKTDNTNKLRKTCVKKPEEKVMKQPDKCTKNYKIPRCCHPEYSDELDSGGSSPTMCCPGDPKTGKHFAILGSQNPELLAKYSAQALRNAKQTLNAVAFRNMIRNSSQTKSESDACETNAPKSDCKWTNDCICTSCRNGDGSNSICLGDIVKQCYDMEVKQGKAGLEDQNVQKVPVPAKAPVGAQVKGPVKVPVKAAPPKMCENLSHQQHICKVGHTGGGCAGEVAHHASGAAPPDQPCSCCYCTVFGHAPPLTTPVPRNYNETRERLRSILNRKKQKCKPAAVTNDQEAQDKKQPPVVPQAQPADINRAVTPTPLAKQKPPAPVPAKPTPPAAPDPPADGQNQNYLAEKMAKMILYSDFQDKDGQPPGQAVKPLPGKSALPQPNLVQRPVESKAVSPGPHQLAQQQQLIKAQQQALHQQPPAQKMNAPQKPQPMPQLAATPVAPAAAQPGQRAARAPQPQRGMSLSSRDTSVFSTSSGISDIPIHNYCEGCSSDGGCTSDGGSRIEDTRDLDALLQYIEGPSRHVDRGKKRAKKQRQKAKKMESKLLEERAELIGQLTVSRRRAAALRADAAAARRRVEEARTAVSVLKQAQPSKKKGKKQTKMTPAVQGKVTLLAEHLGELTNLMNVTMQELHEAERNATVTVGKLEACENELRAVRSSHSGESEQPERQQRHPEQRQLEQRQLEQRQIEQRQIEHRQAEQRQLEHRQMEQRQMEQRQMEHRQLEQRQMEQRQLEHRQLEQRQLEHRRMEERQLGQRHLEQITQKQMEQQRQKELIASRQQESMTMMKGAMYRVRRSPGDGAVTVSLPGCQETPLSHLLTNPHLKVVGESAQQRSEPQKKQTWESALAHINALAKPASAKTKDKKKQKEAERPAVVMRPQEKVRPVELLRSQSLTDAQSLSKKQRKVLAKQQAEEEEARCKQQEAKAKKTETKKAEPPAKVDAKKETKKLEIKKTEAAKKIVEEVGKGKKEKVVATKGKENKAVNNAVPVSNKQQKATPPPAPAPAKAKKKGVDKVPPAGAACNTTVDHTRKGAGGADTPASCSIMEQLSCGVQVADLKLPPGITLTRVQPSQHSHAPTIKSVPLWKCNQLPATPTPVARPQPVINADPSLMLISTAHPEPLKPIIISEPTQPAGKSKKAKKKAKKAAAAAAESRSGAPTLLHHDPKKDGTKMVTLRNPMFHPNLPPVQMSSAPAPNKKPAESIRIPDPIPMPPNACQATITPTSNGMYTIRNPLMSMVHQQNLMGMRGQSPAQQNMNPHVMTSQPSPQFQQAYVVNQNMYNPGQPPLQNPNAQTYVLDSQMSPKNVEQKQQSQEYAPTNSSARLMNLASFTQKNDEGYSLFKTPEESTVQANTHFLTPESMNYGYIDNSASFANQIPKPVVSPNPIGTRPHNSDTNHTYDRNDSSLFTNNQVSRPEPIGTPLKRAENDNRDFGGGLYTPFGQTEDRDFRAALFQSEKSDFDRQLGLREHSAVPNGDPLPYFQRLRVGARLNNEVTIHHVTESKFYKPGQEPIGAPGSVEVSLVPTEEQHTRASYPAKTWTAGLVTPSPSNSTSSISSNMGADHQVQYNPNFGYTKMPGVPQSSGASSVYDSVSNSSSNSPQTNDSQFQREDEGDRLHYGLGALGLKDAETGGFGAIGQTAPIGSQRMMNGSRQQTTFYPENSVFAPDRTITNLNELDSSERDIESFKRFDFYFEPPKNKPKINLNVHDIAAQLKPKDK